ncbi:expressed unknown protein [Seminavis robusta]|uniref:Uncharacterized protein n=1 Tax=Seminavis robusta TaxID=568900 RepID=A0A9N8DV71_9STRA|nr:expressed unknown protein [Seminavis robusta]|eukprot:Sro307_g113220.1 n/a (505) ;mRNA; r:22641-24155
MTLICLKPNPRDTPSSREQRSVGVDPSLGRKAAQSMRATRSIDLTFGRNLPNSKSLRGDRTTDRGNKSKKHKNQDEQPRARSASPIRQDSAIEEPEARSSRSMSPKLCRGTSQERPLVTRSKSTGEDTHNNNLSDRGARERVCEPNHSRSQRGTDRTRVPISARRTKSDGSRNDADSSWRRFSAVDFSSGLNGCVEKEGKSCGIRELSAESVAARLSPVEAISQNICSGFEGSLPDGEDRDAAIDGEPKTRSSCSVLPRSTSFTEDPIPRKSRISIVDSGVLDNSSWLDHSGQDEGGKERHQQLPTNDATNDLSGQVGFDSMAAVTGVSRCRSAKTLSQESSAQISSADRRRRAASPAGVSDLSALVAQSVMPTPAKNFAWPKKSSSLVHDKNQQSVLECLKGIVRYHDMVQRQEDTLKGTDAVTWIASSWKSTRKNGSSRHSGSQQESQGERPGTVRVSQQKLVSAGLPETTVMEQRKNSAGLIGIAGLGEGGKQLKVVPNAG